MDFNALRIEKNTTFTQRLQNMSIQVADFFTTTNAVGKIQESDYRDAQFFINAAKSFARSTHQCVYVIDYFKQGFIYVSESLAHLCGKTSEEIMDMGYELYIRHVPSKELVMLTEIKETGFKFFYNIPVEERMNYIITYDFHLVNDKKKILIHHQITPLALNEDGRVWLALCTISMSSHNMPGKIVMRKDGCDVYYEYNIKYKRWEEKRMLALNDIEKDILRLSAQGYTIADIANHLFKSVDTIKGYKRLLFKKMDVRNIAEAVSTATNYRML